MPHRALAKQLLNELARQFGLRRAPRTSDPQSAASGTGSKSPNERAGIPEPDLGTRLHLVSFGVVATAIVIVFFGLGFLLAHPNEQQNGGRGPHDRSIEAERRSSNLAPPSGREWSIAANVQTELPHPATASSASVPATQPEAHDVLRSAGAPAAGTMAPNTTFNALSSQTQPGLRSNADEAPITTPAGITNAQTTGSGRHHHAGARHRWAGVSRPGANGRPQPPISRLEEAWRWIVGSATGIIAALSPPPRR